jgi:hypothetical protein
VEPPKDYSNNCFNPEPMVDVMNYQGLWHQAALLNTIGITIMPIAALIFFRARYQNLRLIYAQALRAGESVI